MSKEKKPPALSASIAKILIAKSPLHAWTAHYDLNPNFVREEKKAFDLGNAAHALLLEGDGSKLQIIEADSYRKAYAQEQRDAAYAAGKIPILMHELAEVTAMVKACRDQLEMHADAGDAFTIGEAEVRIEWWEGDVRCKGRIDWLMDDGLHIVDYKSINQSANPDRLSRSIFNDGLDIQAAMYIRGVKAVYGAAATFQAVYQETDPPYAVCVVGLQPSALALAQAKVDYAIKKWSECLRTNQWPGYPTRTCFVECPAYAENAWLEKEARD